MPGRDGKGPDGKGPMTGWGRGLCNENDEQIDDCTEFMGREYGRGFRGGRGRCRRRGRFNRRFLSDEDRIKMLEDAKKNIEDEIERLK